MVLYQIKAGQTISHAGVDYSEGDRLELTPELALHHAANIEVVNDSAPNPPMAVAETTEETELKTRRTKKGSD